MNFKGPNRIAVIGAFVQIELCRRGKQSLWATIDGWDLQVVSAYRWIAQWSDTAHRYYAYTLTGKPRKKIYLHRLITNAPVGTEVDHLDHDGLNNRQQNLIVGSKTSNQQNRSGPRKGSASGIKGVHLSKAGWHVRFMRGRRIIRLGTFKSLEEATEVAKRFAQ